MNKIKEENKILIMLAFFSISVGLWGNFRQLWLQDNNFAVTDISNILSIGTFISVIIIALIGKYVKLNKLKNMLVIVLITKFINMIWLYSLNQLGSTEFIINNNRYSNRIHNNNKYISINNNNRKNRNYIQQKEINGISI